MIIAFTEHMRAIGLNPQKQLHVTAVDIDITAVHMTFVQLSLLGIPAVIVHGDVLRLQEWSHWRTPFHVTGFWEYRLRNASVPVTVTPPEPPQVAQPALFEATT